MVTEYGDTSHQPGILGDQRGTSRTLSMEVEQMGMVATTLADEVLHAAFARLERLALLSTGWDGEEAFPPSTMAVQAAREILNWLNGEIASHQLPSMKPYLVEPTPDGGILLEWKTNARFLVIEIADNGTLGYALIRNQHGNRSSISEPDISKAAALRQITELYLSEQ